jgi:hypothetical protein
MERLRSIEASGKGPSQTIVSIPKSIDKIIGAGGVCGRRHGRTLNMSGGMCCGELQDRVHIDTN